MVKVTFPTVEEVEAKPLTDEQKAAIAEEKEQDWNLSKEAEKLDLETSKNKEGAKTEKEKVEEPKKTPEEVEQDKQKVS